MAHETSELWKSLFALRNTKREYKFDIDGVEYDETSEISHSVNGGTYNDFGIGNTMSSTLRLRLFADNIPRGAVIKRYVRLVNHNTVSEWLPKGVYYCNTRASDDDIWDVTAFDAMKKADVPFVFSGDIGEWPRSASNVVSEIAQRMGIAIDARTVLDASVNVPYPNDLTMREVLSNIAVAHIGNWVISDLGELWLIPLLSAPEETNYLVTETGNAITIGGVRILVS